MSKVTRPVQTGKEKAEGRPQRGLQLPHDGSGKEGTDLFSLVTSYKTQGNARVLCQAATGEVQAGYQEEVLHREGCCTLEQALQEHGHGTKPVGVLEVFGLCSQSYGLNFWVDQCGSRSWTQ